MSENQRTDVATKEERPLRFAVIGAGMSGILMGIKLQEAGLNDFTIYEKAERLGGTWRDNTYPGLSCDIPSHFYSYSFEPNSEWTRLFSPGPEIQEYFERVAAKYRVDSKIQFNKEITRAEFVDGKWHLDTQDGDRDIVDIVMAATGVLRDPVYPHIEGLDSFAGDMFHSARWNHGVALDGKRIGIIGTGSTAIQIVPAVIDQVAELSLFQRTAQWVLPLANPFYSEEEKQKLRDSPDIMKHIHKSFSETIENSFARAVVGDSEQLQIIAEACQTNLDDNIKDPELREKLTPDYIVACKRLIMSDEFYPAIQKPNANLVTSEIECIEAAGIRTKDGKLHELDILVIATGFDGHRFMRPMQIIGNDGITLDEVWADATQAYRSVSIPEFPNFFMMLGPNSPIGNFSLIEIAEIQIDYLMQIINLIREGRYREICAKKEPTARFNASIQESMKDTVWVTGCRSWYLDKNGNPAMWPWTFDRFRSEMRSPNFDDFELIA